MRLWNPRFPYHVHKILQVVPILSEKNLLHTLQDYYAKIHFLTVSVYA
jgi:hypothetical protein